MLQTLQSSLRKLQEFFSAVHGLFPLAVNQGKRTIAQLVAEHNWSHKGARLAEVGEGAGHKVAEEMEKEVEEEAVVAAVAVVAVVAKLC